MLRAQFTVHASQLVRCSAHLQVCKRHTPLSLLNETTEIQTRYRPDGGETIRPRRWQFDGGKNRGGSTGRRSPHLWWPAVAKLQAASVPIA